MSFIEPAGNRDQMDDVKVNCGMFGGLLTEIKATSGTKPA